MSRNDRRWVDSMVGNSRSAGSRSVERIGHAGRPPCYVRRLTKSATTLIIPAPESYDDEHVCASRGFHVARLPEPDPGWPGHVRQSLPWRRPKAASWLAAPCSSRASARTSLVARANSAISPLAASKADSYCPRCSSRAPARASLMARAFSAISILAASKAASYCCRCSSRAPARAWLMALPATSGKLSCSAMCLVEQLVLPDKPWGLAPG